jgi:DNA-binding CsgD family transcriptional regulator
MREAHAGRQDVVNGPPLIRPYDRELAGGDTYAQTMAWILDLLTTLTAANFAGFAAVNGRGDLTGPVVGKMASVCNGVTVDADKTLRTYMARYAARNPLSPRYWAKSDARILTARDIGGHAALRQTPLGKEFLPKAGLGAPTVMFFREHGRITGSIVLLREISQPEITPAEIAILLRIQPFLEHTHALAHTRRPYRSSVHLLTASGLTPREGEIMHHVILGASNEEIARTLYIGIETVKTHVKHAFAKLGVHSRTEAALLLSQHQQP